jgi:hypothetical protein
MKKCKSCLLFKPLTEFYRHAHTADRLRQECKPCYIELTEARRKANPERRNSYLREYTKRPEVKERRNDALRVKRFRMQVRQG